MKPYRYSKTHSLVNLSSSFLKYFGVTPFHTTVPEMDKILNDGKYEKVTVILFDGLNKYIKGLHLTHNDALIKKAKFDITSVFPPTTVAATNAFLSGKYPYENGWLGWSQHFNDLNVSIDMFTNSISKTKEKYPVPNIANQYCSYSSIIDLINEKGDGKAYSIFPDRINGEAKNLNHFFELLDYKMKGNSKQFIYAYWPDPDHTIHVTGTKSRDTKTIIKYINKHVKNLAKKNPDNLIVVIADHGLIDNQPEPITEHQDFYELLEYKPSCDTRAQIVKVKEGKKELFEELFNKYYSDRYLLVPAENIYKDEWFGFGEKHKYFDNFIGDYLITSLTPHSIDIPDSEGNFIPFIGSHSGSMEEEYLISVAIFNQKQ